MSDLFTFHNCSQSFCVACQQSQPSEHIVELGSELAAGTSMHKRTQTNTHTHINTHHQQTEYRQPRDRLYVRWGQRCSSPWELWAPPAGGGHIPRLSPQYRSSIQDSGCRGRRRTSHTAPASPWSGSLHPSLGRSSDGKCQRTLACPSVFPAANRAWRSQHRKQQHTAGTAGPR